MIYNNYHKHSHRSNIFTPDTHVKNEDYAKRSNELGHKTLFSTEHGYGGSIFEVVELAEKYNLKPLFAVEGYIVPNINEKDNRNYHIMIIPKDDKHRRQLNKISSNANKLHYYYKPRINIEDLLNCDPDGFYITTACCGGLLKDDDSYEKIFKPLYNHFNKNILLETQTHTSENQKIINKKAIELSRELGLSIIHANDSHYIYKEDSKDRLLFLDGKGIRYGEEDDYVLDYPDYDTVIERYEKQGVLTKEEAIESLNNTLIFDDIINIEIGKDIKMPNIYPKLSPKERLSKLKNIIVDNFNEIIKEDNITEEEIPLYKKAINEEYTVIRDTASINSMDYFLLNYKLIDLAINKYGGVLTTTSRGSAGSFYINRLLGITQLDRVRAEIPLYYERFMSTARLLGDNPPFTSSLPDVDLNLVDPEPFREASRELLGDNGCEWMMAYGTMKEGEAFRNTCRSKGLKYDDYNEVAKDLDKYKENKQWKSIIEESSKFVDVIVSVSPHPCSNLLFSGDLREELGVVKVGATYCCPITSSESDTFRYLKNDYLTVSTVDLTKKTFDMLNKPVMGLVELKSKLDDKVWNLFKEGVTCVINQFDSNWATDLSKKYSPSNVAETSMFNACIRPNFNDYRDDFISREYFTNGNEFLDDLFSKTDKYILYQENLMQWFEAFGVSPEESITLIKKISKKKIKESDFKDLEVRLKKGWVDKLGTEKGFYDTWGKLQSMMGYGYCSAHSLAMAYDALYNAYLKSHHPLEFFSVALEMYSGDEERTIRLTNELDYFDIKILKPRWGKAKGGYNPNKSDNTITKGLGSIKYINKTIGDELYDLSKQKQYDNFIELLIDMQQTSINSRQLEILIKLDFFDVFGKSQKLLSIYNYFQLLHGKKSFKKSTLETKAPELLYMIPKYSTETPATYKNLDSESMLKEVITTIPDKSIPIKDLLSFQLEVLGYIDYKNPDLDKKYVLVTGLNTKYSPIISTMSLGSGKSVDCKCTKKLLSERPVKQGDIIYISKMSKKDKMKKVGEDEKGKAKFEKVLGEFWWHIDNYSVIKNLDEVLEG